MDANTIKFKTMQHMNGVRYLGPKQVEELKYIMCHNLKIEKTEDNFKAVECGIKTYFEAQNNVRLV